MSDWQPEETAPKDGTYILAYDWNFRYLDDGEENPHIVQWEKGRWRIQLDGQTKNVTHWMPLPEPPNAD